MRSIRFNCVSPTPDLFYFSSSSSLIFIQPSSSSAFFCSFKNSLFQLQQKPHNQTFKFIINTTTIIQNQITKTH